MNDRWMGRPPASVNTEMKVWHFAYAKYSLGNDNEPVMLRCMDGSLKPASKQLNGAIRGLAEWLEEGDNGQWVNQGFEGGNNNAPA